MAWNEVTNSVVPKTLKMNQGLAVTLKTLTYQGPAKTLYMWCYAQQGDQAKWSSITDSGNMAPTSVQLPVAALPVQMKLNGNDGIKVYLAPKNIPHEGAADGVIVVSQSPDITKSDQWLLRAYYPQAFYLTPTVQAPVSQTPTQPVPTPFPTDPGPGIAMPTIPVSTGIDASWGAAA